MVKQAFRIINANDILLYIVPKDVYFHYYFFFFQAEDGIRARTVTGVQTCALPIFSREQAEGGAVFELCAINISGGSIGDESFLDYVREQFARFPVRPQSICFETAAIARLDKATHFIDELKSLGCRFSLDDFGAGMSSFAYLKHLPVDFLKIDGGFVKNMADDPIDRAMVEAINSVGHITGKQTIAEFVDGERVIALLREIGVDFAQGYGVAKPKPFGPRLQMAAATG